MPKCSITSGIKSNIINMIITLKANPSEKSVIFCFLFAKKATSAPIKINNPKRNVINNPTNSILIYYHLFYYNIQ